MAASTRMSSCSTHILHRHKCISPSVLEPPWNLYLLLGSRLEQTAWLSSWMACQLGLWQPILTFFQVPSTVEHWQFLNFSIFKHCRSSKRALCRKISYYFYTTMDISMVASLLKASQPQPLENSTYCFLRRGNNSVDYINISFTIWFPMSGSSVSPSYLATMKLEVGQ